MPSGLPKIAYGFTPHLTSTCSHSHRFVTPFARTDTYLNSLVPSTINLWNSLPKSLVILEDINKFKEDLSLYFFPAD